MQKNQWIEDKYIGPDGIMVTNQWVDDRYVDDSGLKYLMVLHIISIMQVIW